MEKTVNYIVACYAGKRRHYGYLTPIVKFVDTQIAFLQQKPKHITQATFVFNQSDNPEEAIAVAKCIQAKTMLHIPVQVIVRENKAVSYGAWQEALLNCKNVEYAFLIEDDYVPNCLDFLDYFFAKCNESVKFVASLFDRNHAAIANGLIVMHNVNQTKQATGNIFQLNPDNSYALGSYYNQIHFLDLLEGRIVDITDVGYTEFLDAGRNIMQYRNNTLPLLIKPIQL
jgi:hypothetical protein